MALSATAIPDPPDYMATLLQLGQLLNSSLDLKQVTSMEDLNARLDAWIQTAYHRTPHGGLPANTTPLQRWQRDIDRKSVV